MFCKKHDDEGKRLLATKGPDALKVIEKRKKK